MEPKQTFWDLLIHFFYDVTHFDGKFFRTIKLLMLRPGYLSKEYIAGRRIQYLDPIRMYLFISSVFFVIMLSVLGETEYISSKDTELFRMIDSSRTVAYEDDIVMYNDEINGRNVFVMNVYEYLRHGEHHYDSLLKVGAIKRNLAQRYFDRRAMATYEVYDKDPMNFIPKFVNKLKHSISKGFFISLPVFALFLYLLHFRKRKQYYFVTHSIFAIHYYSISFIFILLGLLAVQYDDDGYFSSLLLAVMIMVSFIYLYLAMLRFYGQHWFKTLIKYLVFSLVFGLALTFIIIIIIFNSLFYLSTH